MKLHTVVYLHNSYFYIFIHCVSVIGLAFLLSKLDWEFLFLSFFVILLTENKSTCQLKMRTCIDAYNYVNYILEMLITETLCCFRTIHIL